MYYDVDFLIKTWFQDYYHNYKLTSEKHIHHFPPAMISESSDKYFLRILIPGLSADEFTLTIEENELTLEGEFPYVAEKYLIKSRVTGKFKRSFSFKHCVDTENILSELRNGMLYIELNKEESEKVVIKTHELDE